MVCRVDVYGFLVYNNNGDAISNDELMVVRRTVFWLAFWLSDGLHPGIIMTWQTETENLKNRK
jgi:hypothetical protein